MSKDVWFFAGKAVHSSPLEIICPQLLEGTGVTATKVVIWETPEACAEASLDAAPRTMVYGAESCTIKASGSP